MNKATQAQEKARRFFPDIRIVEETYTGSKSPCDWIDGDGNRFTARADTVTGGALGKKQRHSTKPLSVDEAEQRIQAIVPGIRLDRSTYKDSQVPARWFYPDGRVRTARLHKMQHSCHKFVYMYDTPADDVARIILRHNPHAHLVVSSYVRGGTCTFQDTQFGLFKGKVPAVMHGKTHPQRAYLNYLTRWDGRHHNAHPEVQARTQSTNRRRYGYGYVSQVPEFQRRRSQTLWLRHHVTSLVQLRKKYQHLLFLPDGRPLAEFCREHEVRHSTGWWILKFHGYEGLLAHLVTRENGKAILEQIASQLLGVPFFNREIGVKRYRPDFRLSEGLYLNVDGLYYHSEAARENRYHLSMRKNYEEANLRILQFYEDEVRDKPEIVRSMIRSAMGETGRKLDARKCVIRVIDRQTFKDFCTRNHVMGPTNGCTSYGLYDKDELVSVMGLRVRGSELHIERFCTILNTTVRGAFGRLLKTAIQDTPDASSVVSFCDMRYANGRSYERLGFVKTGETLGFCWTDGLHRFHRMRCRAGGGMTERQHAEARRWHKLYDAGQARYELRINR